MASEVIKTRNGYRLRFRGENGEVLKIRPGKIHLPPNPEAEERSRKAVQEYFRQRYEREQAARV